MFKNFMKFMFGRPLVQYESVSMSLSDDKVGVLVIQADQATLISLSKHLRRKGYEYLAEQRAVLSASRLSQEDFTGNFSIHLNVRDGVGSLTVTVGFSDGMQSKDLVGYLRDQTYEWFSRSLAEKPAEDMPEVIRSARRHAGNVQDNRSYIIDAATVAA